MMARVDRRNFLLGGSAALLLPSPAPAAPTVPQFIDAFTAWYNTAKLPIPLRIDKQDHGVDFAFEGYSSILKGWAGRGANGRSYELYVSAEYKDDHDILIWPDRCIPEQQSDGWVCATCVQDAPTTKQPIRIFPSAEAIWRDHLFNVLSEWLNKTLVPAKYMVFGEYGVIFHRELPDLRWHEMIRLGPDSCGQRWRRKMHTYLEQKGFAGEALEVEYERRLRTNKLHDFLLHVGV